MWQHIPKWWPILGNEWYVIMNNMHPSNFICSCINTWNYVHNMSGNTHLQIKIYDQEFYHCIAHTANEERHIIIIYILTCSSSISMISRRSSVSSWCSSWFSCPIKIILFILSVLTFGQRIFKITWIWWSCCCVTWKKMNENIHQNWTSLWFHKTLV